jgi:hypothetical protein
MDSEAIVVWIETVVRIVDYMQRIDNVSLTSLLQIVECETWEIWVMARTMRRGEIWTNRIRIKVHYHRPPGRNAAVQLSNY